jgi:hypothetical protein
MRRRILVAVALAPLAVGLASADDTGRISDGLVGTYAASTSWVINVKDSDCRQIVNERRLTMSVFPDGAVYWELFSMTDSANCASNVTAVATACYSWGRGTAEESHGKKLKLDLQLGGRDAAPADLRDGTTEWSCNHVSVSLPDGVQPISNDCIRIGPKRGLSTPRRSELPVHLR